MDYPAGGRELRIAPVMTGGTSLAVWIGGVTAELYRVVNRDPSVPPDAADVYGRILDLTDTRAIVDVITGTSAGGLNSVLLATAWTYRVPTSAVVDLRNIWLELGSINALLRKPTERNPPSLLRGDDYFWPELTTTLERLAGLSTVDVTDDVDAMREVDLAVTVTTLEGEPTTRLDDLDQRLTETRQAQTLHFLTADFGQDDDWAKRLALAARTSASIPGVFEASYLPVDENVRGRPSFRKRASFSVGRWAVDGGVLVNMPLGNAMDRIFERPADTDVRRVALYVNPTPTETGAAIAEDPKQPPSLLKVISSAYTAPRNQGIATDIDRLRAHNAAASRSIDIRQSIARLLTGAEGAGGEAPEGPDQVRQVVPVDIDTLASWLFPQFKSLRAESAVSAMLDLFAPYQLTESPVQRRQVQQCLVQAIKLGGDFLPDSFDPATAVVPYWTWGLAPLDYAAGYLFDLIARVYRLPSWLVDDDRRLAMGPLRAAIYRTRTRLAPVRLEHADYWTARLRSAPTTLSELQAWAATSFAQWPSQSDDRRVEARKTMHDAALELASTAVELRGQLLALVDIPPDVVLPREIDECVRALRELVGLLGTDDVTDVARRLVALHITAFVFGDETRRSQPVELVEVSWNVPNAVDPRSGPEKLAGTEFSRLGAFMIRSWRANDWMWGRLDGAYQLVLLLLEPARLRQLDRSREQVCDALGLPADGPEAAELSFLRTEDPPSEPALVPIPRSLPKCATFLAKRLQLDIAKQELPHVYEAVLRSATEGSTDGDGQAFRRAYRKAAGADGSRPLTDESATAVLRACRIGDEEAGDQLGQDLMTRTAGEAIVVASNAISGDQSGVGWLRNVAGPVRQVGLSIYAVTRATTTATRTGFAVSVAIFGTAAAILAAKVLGATIPTGVALLAATVLVAGSVLALVRSGLWSQLPAVVALVVVSLSVLGKNAAEVFSNPTNPPPEWKAQFFTGTFSVVVVLSWVAAAFWILALLGRTARTFRSYTRGRRIAEANRRALATPGLSAQPTVGSPVRPPFPVKPVIEIFATIIVVPVVLLFERAWFDYLLNGSGDEAPQSWLISAGNALDGRPPLVIVGALVAIGILLGVGWDRSFRPIVKWIGRRVRVVR